MLDEIIYISPWVHQTGAAGGLREIPQQVHEGAQVKGLGAANLSV